VEDLSPVEWAVRPLKKYTDFSGRAPRAEYWWYTLAVTVAIAITKVTELALGIKPVLRVYGPISLVVLILTIVASIAVQVRRLHDTNRSGWWLLSLYIPELVIIVAAGKPGEEASTGPVSLILIGLLSIVMLVMGIVMLIFFVQRGTEGQNRYGPDPYGPESLEEVFA
jgi:uncharacterized membrane protein YhaH (DUF805 family)